MVLSTQMIVALWLITLSIQSINGIFQLQNLIVELCWTWLDLFDIVDKIAFQFSSEGFVS